MHSNNAASGDEPVPLQEIDHDRNGLFWLIERLTMGGIMHVGHLDVRTSVVDHSGGRLCSLGPEVCISLGKAVPHGVQVLTTPFVSVCRPHKWSFRS